MSSSAKEAWEISQQNHNYKQKLDEYLARMEKRDLLTNSCLHDVVNSIIVNASFGSLILTTSDLMAKGLRIDTLVTIPMWIFSAALVCKIFLNLVSPVSEEETFIGKRDFKPYLILGSLFGFAASFIIFGEKMNLSPFIAKPLLIQISVLLPSVLIGSIVGVIFTRQFMKSS